MELLEVVEIKLKCIEFAKDIGVTYRGCELISVDVLAKELYNWVMEPEVNGVKNGTTKGSATSVFITKEN